MITLKNKLGIVYFIHAIVLCHLITPLYSKNNLPYIEEYRLENGVRVLIAPNYDNPIAYVNVYINASKLDDYENQIGISTDAFYAMGQGTSKYPSEDHIRDKLFSLGSDDGSFKRFHMNFVHGTIQDYFLKEDLKEGLELISEILIHPTYPIWLEKFLSSIVFATSPKTSLIRIKNLPYKHNLHQYANIYHNIHPTPIASKKKLLKWHHNFITPANITIMVSGDVNAIYVKKMMDKYFGDWQPSNKIPEKRNYSINLNDKTGIKLRFIHVENNKDALIDIVKWAPSTSDKRLYAGILARDVFGADGFSSRLKNIHSKFEYYGELYSSLRKHPTIPYIQIRGNIQYEELSRLYNELKNEFKTVLSVIDKELINYYFELKKDPKSIILSALKVTKLVTLHYL